MTRVPGLLENEGTHDDRNAVTAGIFDAAQHQHLGPGRRHLEHLLVRDPVEATGGGDDARVGRVDPVDVGVDLADLGVEGGREGDRRRVGAAATQGGDLLGVLGDALEPGDDDDVAVVERLADAAGRDVDDAGLAVGRVGDDAGLRAGEGPRLEAEVGDGHREHGHRDPLACGEQHVELAGRRDRRHLLGQVEQLVGGVTHRGDHDDDLVAGPPGVDDALGDPLDPLGVGDGRTAVLLDDEPHSAAPGSATERTARRSRAFSFYGRRPARFVLRPIGETSSAGLLQRQIAIVATPADGQICSHRGRLRAWLELGPRADEEAT